MDIDSCLGSRKRPLDAPVDVDVPSRIRGGMGNPYANTGSGSGKKTNPYANRKPASSQGSTSQSTQPSQSSQPSQRSEQLEPDWDEEDEMAGEGGTIEETVDEELKEELAKVRQRWARPDCPSFTPQSRRVSFQWLDIDMTQGPPLTKNPKPDEPVPGSQVGPVPIIRVYGCTEEGWSICTYVHGFTPYGLFAVPDEFENTDENKAKVRQIVNERLKGMARGGRDFPVCCNGIEVITDRQSILGFNSQFKRFFKIFVSVPTFIPPLKRMMSDGIPLPGCGNSSCQAFETNVPFVLRYMIDMDINGAGWLTASAGSYSIRSERDKKTHCQLEIDIAYNQLESHASVGEWNKIAPLRVLSFDIECQGRKGYFPEAEKDPVIQIANCVSVYGTKEPVVKNVFTLKGCLPIVGTQVICSDKEEQMLMKWQNFLQAVDVDIITGYNVQNFDIPYLLDRAEALTKMKRTNMASFKLWGRVKGQPAKMKESKFESAAYGKRNNIDTTIDGRVIFDMLPYMQRNHKLSSYSLNSVCAEYLGAQKEDVHHSIISDLQNGSDETRHRLAVYCVKDALLPQQLMDKLSVLINYIEMARVTGVPVSFLISRGQQIKVFSMLLRKCRKEKLTVPDLKRGPSGGDGVAYEGATVLDPIKKYYQVPISTLDFASLYPSIMQAYNLCYSTLITESEAKGMKEEDYHRNDNGLFVKAEKKKGILPQILAELLASRKQAKKDMKNAPNAFERAVQNGRQLALKISANSVYGFTGATVGQLPCLPIASSVTKYGRYLLEKTKEFVEDHYTKDNGYEHDAVVVYGDTDSVMVKFGDMEMEKVFKLSEDAAEKCSALFPHPILLEFEKVYYPYLLMNKKRYAGLMWTNMEKYDYMDTKGLETVRRDNCQLVRDVIQTSLNKILIGKNVEGAKHYVKKQISDLLQNKMDISRLVITKSLNKGAEYALGIGGKKEDYKMKAAHVELAARMKKRDAGSAPQMGDRVPYVMTQGIKGAPAYDRGEDPIYVLENSIPIDSKWYLTNQLEKPLTRIFEPIIDNVQGELLSGDHTRKIYIATPKATKGSMMMFAVKKNACMGCKVLIGTKEGNLCKNCIPKEALFYLNRLNQLNGAEREFSSLWSSCQRIHSNNFNDIMCTGDGCSCQFYRRKKVQQDANRFLEQVEKFGSN